MARFLVVLAMSTVVACPGRAPSVDDVVGEGEGEGEGDTCADDSVVDDLPADFIAALDAWALRCQPPPLSDLLALEPDHTPEQLAVHLRATAGGPLQWRDDWRAWRLRDVAAVGFRRGPLGCLTRMMAGGCDVDGVAALLPRIIVPRLSDGEPCVLADECVGGACRFDLLSPCVGFCAVAAVVDDCRDFDDCSAGERCDVDGDCVVGGVCERGSCRMLAGELCAFPGHCRDNACTEGVCASSHGAGGSCLQDFDCAAPFLCVGDTCGAGAVGDFCADRADCAGERDCLAGRCDAGVDIGGACGVDQCVSGARCEAAVCMDAPFGATCSLHAECADDGFCEPVTATCQPKRARGEPTGFVRPDVRCTSTTNWAGLCGATAPTACLPLGSEPTVACAVVDEGPCGGLVSEPLCLRTLTTRECIYDDATSTSSCGDRPGPGERCITADLVGSGGTCAIGLVCASTGANEPARCRPLPGAGEPCFFRQCDARVARCDALCDTCVAYPDYAVFVPDEARCAAR